MRSRTIQLILFFLMPFIMMAACGDQPDKKDKTEKTKVTQKAKPKKKLVSKKPKKKKFPKLSNDNVVKVLSEYGENHPQNIVLLKTTKGDIKIRLYDGTPLHRANFLMLTNRDFYDETVFYRVEQNFIVQGGDSDAYERRTIKRKVGYYSIPEEMQPNRYYHKPGAVSMARDYEDNPDKRSSSYDFFIVHGTTYNDYDLDEIEKSNNIKFTKAQRKLYTTTGGAAHLDGQHTVFGQVIDGMEVIDSIAAVEVDGKSWPKKDISMTVHVIK
ncbi:peptidylprolyl isomerase [Salinivirga cyanobacteriivorans]|nr:peptidylprolyl isomerase [Salinivirga cyanobacteriivorans]